MVCFYKELLGKATIKQNGHEFELEIRKGNCLAVVICVDYQEDTAQLYSFFADEKHLKNVIKGNENKAFWDDIVQIKLNLKHKEPNVLLKHFVKCGYEVVCYYE